MKELTFEEYAQKAKTTAVYPFDGGSTGAISYCVLGLAGEAGEVADKWKKVLRDKGGQLDNETRLQLAKEIGDVLWYAAQLAGELGLDFHAVASMNLEKLAARKERGVLGGSGDNR